MLVTQEANPAQPPTIDPNGVVPLYSTVGTIQPGEWMSIYGSHLANGTSIWNGGFPMSLGGTSVTIDGVAAYLWYVSPGQINLASTRRTQTGTCNGRGHYALRNNDGDRATFCNRSFVPPRR